MRMWNTRPIILVSTAALMMLFTTGLRAELPTELAKPDKANAPIVHEKFYRGERELFGYAPAFEPNPVGFDLNNRPYIRNEMAVQTPNDDGVWTKRSVRLAVTQHLQIKGIEPTFDIVGGQFVDQRVVFDEQGDAYTIVKAKHGSRIWLLLLHSRDRCASWDVYTLPPLEHARLEMRDGHNTLTHPPAVLVFKGHELNLVLPRRTQDGSLIIDRAVTVANDSLLVPNHSGGGNSVVTVGDRVTVVYPSAIPPRYGEGTSQFAVALSRTTGRVVTRKTLLGTVGVGKPDPHYLPAITADSLGTLHVVLGSHHDSLYYLHSTKPHDASRWTPPKTIGKQRIPTDGGHTYPALLCDSKDQLHLVTRWAGDGYYFRLVYLRGDADTGLWENQKVLVQPFRNMYSNWYHHLSMDRDDRLFLNYRYYGNQLGLDQQAAYRSKWPEDNLPTDARSGAYLKQVRPHDPAMLFSEDGGETWRLAMTPDLRGG